MGWHEKLGVGHHRLSRCKRFASVNCRDVGRTLWFPPALGVCELDARDEKGSCEMMNAIPFTSGDMP